MGDDRALQRRHDRLAIVDRQADVTIKQALPALVDPDVTTTYVAELVLPPIVIVHSTAIVAPPNKTTVVDCMALTIRSPTPEKLPVSDQAGA
ncbi:hypothetical protein [Mesorhizobium sp. Cs1321R2N1]|uniref:hypothetical protein n=1 Tax=Mesorhizobium sp. Cs1321R2N1 TaxID=3015174 RepID=UPI00301B93D6